MRRIGILAIIHRCPRWLRVAGSQTYSLAEFVIEPTGRGGPENAYLMGLPAAYIVRQLADFKSGARKSSVPDRIPAKLKTTLAANVTDAEVQAAAAYFSALKPRAVIRVVETEMVPKTIVSGWFLTALNTDEKEPTGDRIIEVPENLEQFVSRDTRSRFIAYVPTGSIEKGRALAARGDQAVRCGTLSWPRSQRTRSGPRHRRAFAELHRQAVVRL
jgi:hypothetical protein